MRSIGKPIIQGGRTTGLYGSVQDVTDQRALKEADRRLNQLLSTVLDNLPHGVYAKDLKTGGRYALWNRGMETLLKVKAEDVLDRTDDFLYEEREVKRLKKVDQFVLEGKSLLDLAEEWAGKSVDMAARLYPQHSHHYQINAIAALAGVRLAQDRRADAAVLLERARTLMAGLDSVPESTRDYVGKLVGQTCDAPGERVAAFCGDAP